MTINPDFLAAVADHPLSEWLHSLPPHAHIPTQHGDWPRWQAAIDELQSIYQTVQKTDGDITVDLRADTIRIGAAGEHTAAVTAALKPLMPWRKGPWSVFGVDIDTEWRCDWKWQRLQNNTGNTDYTGAINFKNKVVLDVGSGNGYYGCKMVGAGARAVLGVDPTCLFIAQFRALQQCIAGLPVDILPLTCEALPAAPVFDVVCSMGVLYHRRSPFAHLMELKELLRPGGELVLETIVIPGDEQAVLVPADRYMRMRNVWFLPSAKACQRWLERLGFVDVKIVDESITTVAEQRSTDWMVYESLTESLAENDHSHTIEGYTAPRRALLTACKKR